MQGQPHRQSEDPSLPTEVDFDPYGGDLDAQCAWRNFGGLTLDEATRKFRERPEIYQEDFMFMGGRAFAFYFPVIESYLRDVQGENDDDDDHESWILACGIKNQFNAETAHHVLHLAPRVMALSQYVRNNIARYGYDADEQRRIADAWLELENHLKTITRS
ncbi:MAG: hypothetical protein ACLQNE_32370 [Thermoguttaceae bacterium]|jgi:hypothetical protein